MASKKQNSTQPSIVGKRPRKRLLLLSAALFLSALIVCGIIAIVTRKPPAMQHYLAGLKLERAGRGAEAAAEWREAIRLDPKYAPPYLALANQAEGAGDMGAAIRVLEELYRFSPNTPHTLGHLAQLYGMANRFETALTVARKAIQADPNDADAHNALGMLLDMADDPVHAAEELGKAHALAPDDEALTLDTARVLALAGRPDEAIALVEQIELNPHARYPVQADYLMGWLLAEYGKNGKKDEDEALKYLGNAVKYAPEHVASNTEIGMIYARQGQDVKALPYLEHAARLGLANPEAIHALAGVYLRLHRPEASEAQQSAGAVEQVMPPLRKARNRYVTHPEDRDNLLRLAELESRVGNAGDALGLAEQVLRNTPDEPAALDLRKRLSGKNIK